MQTISSAIRSSVLVLLLAHLTVCSRAETLRTVLAKHSLSLDGLSVRDLDQPITSYAESADATPFLIAYYDDDRSGILKSPLHVLRYAANDGYSRADLAGVDGPLLPVMREVNSDCLGSALHNRQIAASILIDTHITPSAGCVLALSSELRFKTGLEGWTLDTVGCLVIVHGNEVHFADTHPSTVAIYDLESGRFEEIYPPKEDRWRDRFTAALRTRLPSEAWCRRENKSCDPTRFTSDVSNLEVDRASQGFSFTVNMVPEGFGDKAESEIAPVTVRYKFWLQHGRWIHSDALVP
jgi:hypothetical protein